MAEPAEARPARPWRGLAVAGVLYVGFWAVASAAGWFLDSPFFYSGRANWVTNLAESGSRSLAQPEFLLTGAALVFLLPAIVAGAIYLARRRPHDPFDRWFERPDAQRTVVVLAVAIAVAMAIFVGFALVRHAELLDDERAYLFQARLFAQGKLGLPPPPHALMNPLLLMSPMWTSVYPPGHSLVLAPAVWLHAEYLLPPIFAGVLVLAVWSYARDTFGPKHGAFCALLAGMSPFVWCVHGSVLAFGTSVTCLAVFLAAIARAEKTGKAAWMVLAGAAIGLAFITRPFEAIAFSFTFALRLLWEARRRGSRARLAWCVLGFLALAWILPLHDYLVTGDPLDMPWSSPGFSGFKLGFGHSLYFGELVHSPAQALGNLVGVVLRLDLWALAWPGSLLLVVAGALRKGATRGDRMLRWALAGYVACYVLVPFPGTWDVGPTYYYALVPLLVPLAARGVSALRERARAFDPSDTARRAISWACLLGTAAAATAVFPMRAIRLTALSSQILEPWQMIEDSNIGPAIVIVPSINQRQAPGWSWGHPFFVTTAHGDRVDLISPASPQDLADAVAYLGNKPVYRLVLDKETYAVTGKRHFTLEPFDH